MTALWIRTDVWAPPDVELLPPWKLTALPPVDERAQRHGVYFLFRGDPAKGCKRPLLVYIGVSDDVFARVKSHRSQKKMPFHVATFLAVPWPWHLSVEALYIREYLPEYNLRSRDTGRGLKPGLVTSGERSAVVVRALLDG